MHSCCTTGLGVVYRLTKVFGVDPKCVEEANVTLKSWKSWPIGLLKFSVPRVSIGASLAPKLSGGLHSAPALMESAYRTSPMRRKPDTQGVDRAQPSDPINHSCCLP